METDGQNRVATLTVRLRRAAGPSALVAAMVWSSWPLLVEMVSRWSTDPRYSHGFLVPGFAAYLFWIHRGRTSPGGRTLPVAGLALVVLGGLMNLAGARYYVFWVEAASLLPELAGLALLAAGWTGLRAASRAILFLVFMIPLPYRVENALGAPLQGLATAASAFVLQTSGLPAVMEGNIIYIDQAQIGVIEACNGLGMLLTFTAFAVAVVLVTRMGVFERVLILLSAVPIALAANVTRITATGVLHRLAGEHAADTLYHDLAGWLMMPMAVAAFGVELWILSHLFVDDSGGVRESIVGTEWLPAPVPRGERVLSARPNH